MDAGRPQRSAQAEAKGLWKWRDTVMIVEGFERHPDKHWFNLATRLGAKEIVAVETTSIIHFGSARQTAEFAAYVGTTSEFGRKLTATPHPAAPHYANNEIIEQTWRKATQENFEVTIARKDPFTKTIELKHTGYSSYRF